MARSPLFFGFIVLCFLFVSPVMARENPYRNSGEVSALDIPVPLDSDGMRAAGSSEVLFSGAGYTHKIGRVSVTMNPLQVKSGGTATVKGNVRRYGTDPVVEHEVYRDLIKERVILSSPTTVKYSYDLGLSDWVTIEPDESRPDKKSGPNSTVIVTYPYTKEVTNFAKDSTIDFNPDRWGNLVVFVNGEDVIVMPKPFAIDATGTRFEMDFVLDKKAKTITVSGDLSNAKYPVVVDPTERVTNGGFEAGNKSGWTNVIGNTNYYTVKSDTPYQGTYYLDVIGTGGYSGIRQTNVNYAGVSSVSCAAAIPVRNTYDIPLSNVWYTYGNWYLNNPGQTIHGWTVSSAKTTLTSPSTLDIWTYSNTHGHIDSVSAMTPDAPVAQFVGSPTTGTAPLSVQFTDQSTNTPTSWSWNFGDGGSSTTQNPSHQYASAGTYAVSLTGTNAGGSDGETKTGYVTVSAPQTIYTAYVEGVSDYHGGQPPLGSAVPLASTFYQNVVGSNNEGITWAGYGEYYNDDAGSKHWSATEVSAVKADNADFALFAGHGLNDRIYFGTSNSVPELLRSDMQFGGSKAKWVTLSSCYILDEDTQNIWDSAFNGLHILNSYETEGLLYDRQGGIYAARLTAGTYEGQPYLVRDIRDAWRMTLEDTIVRTDYFGASKWAEPCGNDYLPGYGSFCSAPIKDNNGNYIFGYEKFDCDSETSG